MQKFIAKYATAAHLAFVAVAPLFLFPFAESGLTATALFWLTLVAAAWIFCAPSRIHGETSRGARARLRREVFRDPVFWLQLVVVLMVAVRTFNNGIALGYDIEHQAWFIRSPQIDFLPGSIASLGSLPLAVALAALVVYQGVAHALGRTARTSFLTAASLFSSIAAMIATIQLSTGNATLEAFARCGYLNPSFVGAAFGVWLLVALQAQYSVAEERWHKVEPLCLVALIGNAWGLCQFAPPLEIAVFFAAYLLMLVVSAAMNRKLVSVTGAFRCLVMGIVAFIVPVALAMVAEPGSILAERAESFKSLKLMPEDFVRLRKLLSRIAFESWKESPWIGTGLGSFPLDLRFHATNEDWQIVRSGQMAVLNGWWHLLCERGLVGALMLAGMVLVPFGTWTWRLVRGMRRITWRAVIFLGFGAVLAMAAVQFADVSALRSESMLAAVAVLAVATGSLPVPVAEDVEEKDTKDGR